MLQLSEEYALSVFISNLKPEISKFIRLFHPTNLTYAFNLAKQVEDIVHNPPRKPFTPYTKSSPTAITITSPPPPSPKPPPYTNPRSLPGLLPTPKTPTLPYTTYQKPFNSNLPKPTNSNSKLDTSSPKYSQPPTREERDERRKKGLCMWCGLKFGPGHTCFRSQLYQLLVEESKDKEGESEEIVDCMAHTEDQYQEDNAEGVHSISLHAVWGTKGCQTMRIMGKVKKQNLVFLLDSGSTHNFMDQTVAKKLKCHTQCMPKVDVTVANGETLQVQEICKMVR